MSQWYGKAPDRGMGQIRCRGGAGRVWNVDAALEVGSEA